MDHYDHLEQHLTYLTNYQVFTFVFVDEEVVDNYFCCDFVEDCTYYFFVEGIVVLDYNFVDMIVVDIDFEVGLGNYFYYFVGCYCRDYYCC